MVTRKEIRQMIDEKAQVFLAMSPEEQKKAGYEARHRMINDPNVPDVIRNRMIEIAKEKGELS